MRTDKTVVAVDGVCNATQKDTAARHTGWVPMRTIWRLVVSVEREGPGFSSVLARVVRGREDAQQELGSVRIG